jgi:sigma-B regulation protein RsbU (phosphoserine phosphatase)
MSKERKKSELAKRVRFSLKMKFSFAMIFLTAVIVVFMAGYFIYDESKILQKSIIDLAQREVEHLSVTTKDSLSTDDILPIIALMNDIKTLESVKYAYVLDSDGRVQASTKTDSIGNVLKDKYTKSALKNKDKNNILIQKYSDPEESSLIIYDFSKAIYDKVTGKRRIATARIGFSNKVIRNQIENITRVIIIISLIFIAISIIFAFFLAWFTTKPLKQLSQGVTIIGKGNLDHKIEVKSHDEIGKLADEFNTMTQELKSAKDKEIENRVMEEQLEVAKEIQEGLNPMNFYNTKGVQIKGYTRAAKGVGGDYFDFLEVDDNRVGALISDVSGKGIPASLVMVMIRTVFVSAARRDARTIQCSKVVSAINDSLSADFAIDKFATLFFMIYDRSTQKLSFSNAGHGPLFCYRASKKACSLTKIDGMPIGVMEDVEYQQTMVPFLPGDIIVLYTDGITEMRNKDKDEYGRLRLQKLVIENSDLDANELVEIIVNDVDNFRGEVNPHDDMTTLVMKREH